MLPGEQLIVHTAGAGGWGTPEDADLPTLDKPSRVVPAPGARSLPFTKANGSVSQYAQTQAECD
jgi:5-oxoprolinase (ATP-hydrolysing)